jgi:DNA-binding NtrC family response regulator
MKTPASGPPRCEGTILIVDDETYVRDSLAALLARRGFAVRAASSVPEALAGGVLEGADVVVTDLRMPGRDGLDLLGAIAEREPALPVVVLTGHGSVPSAVECVRAGAFDYLQKPVDPEELVLVLQRALRQSGLRRELDYLRSRPERPADRGPLGVSAAWRKVVATAEIAAPSDTSVLLLGESGTGKEEVAQLLHRRSARASGPFVRVNCAAIPIDLFESEFFGHRRGSFTGAVDDRVGRFKVAHRGTMFLDEVNSLPTLAQAKILRVLQDGRFERVGDSQPTAVDVRLVCASNVDLAAEVDAGRFRPDLFYRINVMTITIPPLRERPEDIPVLAEAFLAELAARSGKRVASISGEAMRRLAGYAWPGNVRELRNVIERGVLLETGESLGAASLPADLGATREEGPADLGLRATLRREERRVLSDALTRSHGVRREAARLLGIDERNLAYYLRKHGLGGLE